MALEDLDAIIHFLVGLLISTVVIYLVTFILRQKRSIKLALLTAIIGAIVYELASRVGDNFLSSVLAGIAWLFALKTIYRMGWSRSLIVAVIIWIVTYLIDKSLTTVKGPL